jgi:hypothetical protein
MSAEYRIEKVPVFATITMASGATMRGEFYRRMGLAPSVGEEDIRDILNASERFFPFHTEGGDAETPQVRLVNRAQVVWVRLGDPRVESELANSTRLTPREFATLVLTTGQQLSGTFRIVMPSGRTRISDYVNAEERFCYLEGADGVFIVNLDHVADILTFEGAAGEVE